MIRSFNDKYFAAMSLGCEEISLIAARWNKNGEYVAEAFCRSAAKGIRKGTITNASQATESIHQALKKLKDKAGKDIHEVYTAISSDTINIMHSSGMVLLSKYGREVSKRDIDRCVDIASAVKMPLDREPLHNLVRGFSIDAQKEIKNPLDIEGVKLKTNVSIVTVSSPVIRNISKCISLAGYVPAKFVFSGLASSYRVLSPEDMQEGVVLLDLCRDQTDAILFKGGIIEDCRVFSVGKDDILADFGNVNEDAISSIWERIESLDGWITCSRYIVISEGTLADGIIEVMEKYFSGRVEAGSCQGRQFEDLPQERMGYIGSLGVLDYLQQEKQKKRISGGPIKQAITKAMLFVDKYF